MGKKRASATSDEDLFQLLAKETGGEVLDDIDNIKFYVDTGNLALNYNCCGKFIGGGYPSGRIVEIYGPSSSSKSLLGANALFSTQRRNGIPAIIDAENAVNKDFLQVASHCDLTKVLRYAPPSLEECFHKINVLIQSVKSQAEKLQEKGEEEKAEELLNKPITIVYDSITVSPCKRELREVDLPDNFTEADYKKIVRSKEQPGERAKICSKELRKLGPLLEGSNVTVIVLNQTRSKVGVLFGCFFYGSKVLLADGTWMKIGKIVNNKLPVEVMSLNVDTGLFEPKKVIGWHDNGNLSEGEYFLKIKFRRNFQNAFGHMMVTPNHKIFTKKHGSYKEVDAGTLKKGDKILCYQKFYLNEDQWQLAYGSVLGDGSLRKKKNHNCQLRFGHGSAQLDYLKFKQSIVKEYAGDLKVGRDRCNLDLHAMYELNRLSHYKKRVGDQLIYSIPDEIVDNLNELGLAIWYMDDGTYAGHYGKWGSGKSRIYCVKFPDKERMLKTLSKFGLYPKLDNKGFVFDAANTLKLHQIICRFVPPCMEYKIHPKYRGLFDYQVEASNVVSKPILVDVVDISKYQPRIARKKFDLTIEDNSNYVVGGAVVHNSNETTGGGGLSLEFYASVRLRTQGQKKIQKKLLGDRKKTLGVNIKVQNVKNKINKPFTEADTIPLMFDTGINPLGGLLSALYEAERIEATGRGNYQVKQPWGDMKFKASLDANTIPLEVLLECPTLVDAKDRKELEDYLAPFYDAINYKPPEDAFEIVPSSEDEAMDMDEDLDAELMEK